MKGEGTAWGWVNDQNIHFRLNNYNKEFAVHTRLQMWRLYRPCIFTLMSAHSEAVLAVCPHKHTSPLDGGQIGFLRLRSKHVTQRTHIVYALSQTFIVILSLMFSPFTFCVSFSRRGGWIERWIEGEVPQERDKAIFRST